MDEISYCCYEDGGLKKHQLEEIVLVHGTTNNSKIKTTSKDNFDGKESNKSFNYEQTIAYGVVVWRGILSRMVVDDMTFTKMRDMKHSCIYQRIDDMIFEKVSFYKTHVKMKRRAWIRYVGLSDHGKSSTILEFTI